MLKSNEHFEPLGKKIKIIVSDVHHFSTDTILLNYFANVRKNDKVIELGTGCGTIPLLIKKDNRGKEITAVDIQEDACSMLERSIQYNRLEGITVVHSDLKDLKGKVSFGYYDLVVCNPPYKEKGTGIENPLTGKTTARHETACSLEDIIMVSSKLLNFGGRLCMCHRPERLTDLLTLMRVYDLEPKRIRLVQQRVNKASKLVLVEGRKGGKKGFMATEPTLMIENSTGDFSPEMMEVYGDYKE